jgi:hypothetical protein
LVKLNALQPEQQVTVSNNLPGPLDINVDGHVKLIKGLSVTVQPLHVEAGSKAVVTFRRTTADKVAELVVITAEPFHREFRIQVESN